MAFDMKDIENLIEKRIEERGYGNDDTEFDAVNGVDETDGISSKDFLTKMEECSAALDGVRRTTAWRPLYGNAIKVFFKKVIRKVLKFLIEPIVYDQDLFNKKVIEAFRLVESVEKGRCKEGADGGATGKTAQTSDFGKIDDKVGELKKHIEAQNKLIEEQQRLIEQQNVRIAEIESKLEKLG